MYIKNNVYDSIYGIILHQPGKTKDSNNDRKDIEEMGIRAKLVPNVKQKKGKIAYH